uniref:hypothetical protein n=1 Tax=Thalassomonas sp. RHCl1 TaxID=2995320 RepID=UPI00248C62A7
VYDRVRRPFKRLYIKLAVTQNTGQSPGSYNTQFITTGLLNAVQHCSGHLAKPDSQKLNYAYDSFFIFTKVWVSMLVLKSVINF